MFFKHALAGESAISGFQFKFHIHRVVIGIGISGVDVFVGNAFHIVRQDKSVQGDGVGHIRHVLHVCVAGAVPQAVPLFFCKKVNAEATINNTPKESC